jgi:hypothetical protein
MAEGYCWFIILQGEGSQENGPFFRLSANSLSVLSLSLLFASSFRFGHDTDDVIWREKRGQVPFFRKQILDVGLKLIFEKMVPVPFFPRNQDFIFY